jgi:hypothetical protein
VEGVGEEDMAREPTFTPDIRSVNTECERLERSFMSVAATLRRP